MSRASSMSRWIVGAMFAFACFAIPRMAEAKEGFCGGLCLKCEGAPAPDYKYGSVGGHATYRAFCTQGSCTTCNVELTKTASERSNSIAMKLKAATPSELVRLVAQHKFRIRVDESRSIAVVLGGCDGNAVESIIVLRPGQLADLRGLKVATLTSHLAFLRERQKAGA